MCVGQTQDEKLLQVAYAWRCWCASTRRPSAQRA